MVLRTKEFDYDARRDPKTELYCAMCQKDLRPGRKYRHVHLVYGGAQVLHPGDEVKYDRSDPGDCGVHPLGNDCAHKLGLQWTRPPS